MALLANWLLEVGGRTFGVSGPEMGDRSLEDRLYDDAHVEDEELKLTLGFVATDLDALLPLTGSAGRLLTGDGRAVARLRVVKVDPILNVVVADVLEVSPLLTYANEVEPPPPAA